MSQGRTPDTASLFNASRDYCDQVLPERSVYRLLNELGGELFPDEYFSDLYHRRGRRSVPPRILATVMVLQRLNGLSDREAVNAFMFDARWKYACGGLDPAYPGFGHTVLVNMRARLRESDAPTRVFDAVLGVARDAGLVGARRVLDSTPLYDAVATQDTVTLIRSAIRGVLRVSDASTEATVVELLERDDSYDSPGKPIIDWTDAEAREQLVDALARDGYAVVAHFDGEKLPQKLDEAVRLLASVLGQDLEEDDEGRFRIMRGVARDRIISTVDPEARHGHKTASNRFDGYKGHVAIDPDSEIITATAVTPGNTGDADVAEDLLSDVLDDGEGDDDDNSDEPGDDAGIDSETESAANIDGDAMTEASQPTSGHADIVERRSLWSRFTRFFASALTSAVDALRPPDRAETAVMAPEDTQPSEPRLEVYGDSSYGAASVLKLLDDAGITAFTRVQQPASIGGRFSQAEFDIDVDAGTAQCPAGKTVPLRPRADGSAMARFGDHCLDCPLRQRCTTASKGRSLHIHPEFERLSRHRDNQQDPAWAQAYKATRPKVERKIGHLVRVRHGGRRARVRGTTRVALDFSLRAAAVNLQRLARMGVMRNQDRWMVPA